MEWDYEINPAKSLNPGGFRILKGPGRKSRLFEVPKPFFVLLNASSDSERHFVDKKRRGYLKKSRFSARAPLES